jgi:hypothetical protein
MAPSKAKLIEALERRGIQTTDRANKTLKKAKPKDRLFEAMWEEEHARGGEAHVVEHKGDGANPETSPDSRGEDWGPAGVRTGRKAIYARWPGVIRPVTRHMTRAHRVVVAGLEKGLR